MKVGIVGLGRMGRAIASRIMHAGHNVVGFDVDEQAREQIKQEGGAAVDSLEELAKQARVIWLMVPAGSAVDETLDGLLPHLQEGDIIIDGGNSKYTNSVARAKRLKEKEVDFLDCGTSGGLLGKKIGFSLTVGGDERAYEKVIPIFKAVAISDGYAHVGPSGAGHYVKMVHNGIEYGLLQAYAEGFHLLKEGEYKDLDLETIANVWQNGAIIRSQILDYAREVLEKGYEFDAVIGEIAEGGTGFWAVEHAQQIKIPVPVIKEALAVRKRSREGDENYATKFVAVMRNKFGGHEVKQKK